MNRLPSVFALLLLFSSVYVANAQDVPVRYLNPKLGLEVDLPQTWRGFTVESSVWVGFSSSVGDVQGTEIVLHYPANGPDPGDDITFVPILVFTRTQWEQVQNEDFRVSAAPIGPSELSENSRWIFGLPPRWTFYGSGHLAGLAEGSRVANLFRGFDPR